MRNKPLLLPFLSVLTGVFLLAKHSPGQSPPLVNRPLTVEQTLGTVFTGEPTWSLFAAANERAKPDLYRLLDNKRIEEYHPAVFRILGFIGENADAKRVEQMLTTRYSGDLSKLQTLAVQAAFESLGLMSRRGVKQASEFFEKFLDPSAAESLNIRWPSVAQKKILNNAQETVTWVFLGYSLSGKTDLKEKIDLILDSVQDPEIKKYLEFRIRLDRMVAYAKTVEQAQSEPVSEETLELLPKLFNKDFENPRRVEIIEEGNTRHDNPVRAEGVFTKEDTVASAFVRYHHRLPWNLYKRANPAAKEVIYKILEDSELKLYHPNTWRLLGHIGDKNTVAFLGNKATNSFSGELTENEQEILRAMFECLGLMAARDVTGASDLAQKMATLGYWPKMNFTWLGKLGSEYEILLWVNEGYAMSGRNDLAAKMSQLIASIKDPQSKDYVQWRISPARLTKMRYSFDPEAISAEDLEFSRQSFNGNMQKPGPKKERPLLESFTVAPKAIPELPSQPLPQSQIELLKQKALKAFEEISADLFNDNYEKLAKNIADNGKPILPVHKQTDASISATVEKLKSMSKDMAATKNLLKELKDGGIRYGVAQGETLSDGTVIVKIPCLESASIKTKHLRNHEGTRTTGPANELIIYMIQQNGQWYWNPFGW